MHLLLSLHWPLLPAADVTVNMSVCWCTTKLVERRLLDLARSCRQSENVTLTDTLQTARSLCECAAMFSQVATCSSTTPASYNRANLVTGKFNWNLVYLWIASFEKYDCMCSYWRVSCGVEATRRKEFYRRESRCAESVLRSARCCRVTCYGWLRRNRLQFCESFWRHVCWRRLA